jgi:hypothetical protein
MQHQSPTARSAGATVPPHLTVHLSAACETGRHAACRGRVLSLAHVGPCQCACHSAASPEPAAA